jgi:hypothetical protein
MDLYVTINHKQKDNSGIMLITKKMFYRYPALNAFFKATKPSVMQEHFNELLEVEEHLPKFSYEYTFNHESASGWISIKRLLLPAIAASQGLILHAEMMLAIITNDTAASITLIDMLHCAIEHQQPEMIDFCVNHPRFKKDLITSKTLLLAAHDGPVLLFKQLFTRLVLAAPNLLSQCAFQAISGGQCDILKQLLEHSPNLIHHIKEKLANSNTFSVDPLTDTLEHHHTEVVRFLLEFEQIKALLPSIGLHLLNHAIQYKHAAAVDLLLRFEAIETLLNIPPKRHEHNTLLLAASAGNAYIFERLLTIIFLKQNLLTDMSCMVPFHGQRQVINAWTSAIDAGHVSIAHIIFDTVSHAEKEKLKTDISVLSHTMGIGTQPGNPKMLEFLFTFEAMQNEFNQKASYYMQMACCISPEQAVLQPRMRDTSIPMFNFLLDTPIIQQKMREDDRTLHARVDEFVTLQIEQLKRVQAYNAAPLSLERYCYFLDMLQKTKWYRPDSAADLAYLDDLPHTLCDDSGVINSRIKCLLPWMQSHMPKTGHNPPPSLRFLDAQKSKRKRSPDDNNASDSDDENTSVTSNYSYS